MTDPAVIGWLIYATTAGNIAHAESEYLLWLREQSVIWWHIPQVRSNLWT